VADPSNTAWQRDLSVSYERLGDVAVSAGKLDDARTWFDKALAVTKALAAADPSNTDWQRDLSVSYERLGDVAVSAGKLDDARTWFDKDLAVTKALAAADPSNAGWQRDYCISLARGAQVVREPTEAMKRLDEARAIYTRLQRDGSFRGDEQFAQMGPALDQLARTRTTTRH
jgi:tetratricopeptide (TPR) repeat protein